MSNAAHAFVLSYPADHEHTPETFIGWQCGVPLWNCACGSTISGPVPTEEQAEQEIAHVDRLVDVHIARGDIPGALRRMRRLIELEKARAARLAR